MEENTSNKKIDFRTKFFYGFGSISFGIKNNGFSYFVLFVYSSVLGLPAWMAGLALNLVLIADAITDPLVGYFSDRTRSRWGRRHPFMYAAALPVAITYYFLWTPPESLTDWQLFSYLLVCAIAIILPTAIDKIANKLKIDCQSSIRGKSPSTNTRTAIAKAASFGALLINRVTEVGAPW